MKVLLTNLLDKNLRNYISPYFSKIINNKVFLP